MTLQERFEKSVPHDERSKKLYKFISDLDFHEGGDCFGFKSGGDGDNGEYLMYLLDEYFAHSDGEQK